MLLLVIQKLFFKLFYYKLFAKMYSFVGSRAEVVMVNSTWTEGHINSLWKIPDRTNVVFPPCNTTTLCDIPFSVREKIIISVAQFRPEKNHILQIESFNELLIQHPEYRNEIKLVLIGSSRNSEDDSRVNYLKQRTKELCLEDLVEFKVNVNFNELKEWLSRASLGLHTMWNEHFGIGVVELMAAGVIPVAHNSGGPKLDIVIPYNGNRTGYLASSAIEYATCIHDALSLSPLEFLSIQTNSRESTFRFSDEQFSELFKGHISCLFEQKQKIK